MWLYRLELLDGRGIYSDHNLVDEMYPFYFDLSDRGVSPSPSHDPLLRRDWYAIGKKDHTPYYQFAFESLESARAWFFAKDKIRQKATEFKLFKMYVPMQKVVFGSKQVLYKHQVDVIVKKEVPTSLLFDY